MIFHRMSSIFLYKKAEVFLLPFFLPESSCSFSQHRLSGGAQTAHAVHPFRVASFLHRLTGARELPQAGSPLTGGKFFAEPQQRNSPSADGGSGAAPAAGAKRKDNLRFSFLFELLPFPYSLVWRRLPTCDRFEKGNGRGFFSIVGEHSVLPCPDIFAVSDTVLLHRSATSSRRDISVSRNSLARYDRQHLRG